MADQPDSPPNLSFEDSLARLEAIVHELEEGSIGLAEALARYEQGVGLLKACYTLLEQAERKIELLTGVDASGAPIVSPMDDDVETLEEKSRSRGRRRTSKASSPPQVKEGCPETDMDAF